MAGTKSYVGSIDIFAGETPPKNWMFCYGQSLPKSEYINLLAILGTIYGGDATNFKLPDLRGRIPIGAGQGPSLTPRYLGHAGGCEKVHLTSAQMPAHEHLIQCHKEPGRDAVFTPANHYPATNSNAKISKCFAKKSDGATMHAHMIADTGGDGHENMMPFCCVNYIICVNGPLPPRQATDTKGDNNGE